MLYLKKITKNYIAGDTTVAALKGIDIQFRENEFVSILGPSGCGKTTLLNIIGGLDKYTDGDLFIREVSTKEYTDSDWDTYRNHSIGFVFQTYNLIPHQTVLSNVELALTLSGVSKTERTRRAIAALEKVGLSDQLYKKPNQMSGGQMQRVAIARALVNNPDILLADEPTGALDTETSVQIMELLKEISADKLVIMVTHNPDLAEKYSTRIVRLLDGEIIDDTNPYTPQSSDEQEPSVTESQDNIKKAKGRKRAKKPSMSFFTAISLSFNNLLTKKARTVLTSFAGSIGIIGIALILALSNGIQVYINTIQRETLSSYPITIQAETVDMTEFVNIMMGINLENNEHKLDKVYSSPVLKKLINSMTNAKVNSNNLTAFKKYLESGDSELDGLISTIDYSYDIDFNVFFKDKNGKIIESDAMKLMQEAMGMGINTDSLYQNTTLGVGMTEFPVYAELLSGRDGALVNDLVYEQYDIISGKWPTSYNEVVLIVNENNEISDFALLALGLTTMEEAEGTWQSIGEGESLDTEVKSWSYEEILGLTYKLVPSCNFYGKVGGEDAYVDLRTTETGLTILYEGKDAITLKVSGIIRPNPDASTTMLNGSIGYTEALTDKIIELTDNSEIVKTQLANPETDIITGLPFKTENYTEPAAEEKKAAFTDYLKTLTVAKKAQLYKDIASLPTQDYIDQAVSSQMQGLTREYIETMLLDAYIEETGMDKQAVEDYMANLTDEQLFEQVELQLTEIIKSEYAKGVLAQLSNYPETQLSVLLDNTISKYTLDEFVYVYDNHMPATVSDSTLENNLSLLGVVSKDSPSIINIYAETFENKDAIAEKIAEYNSSVSDDDKISYTDYVALMMSSITTIIDVVSYVLIAFVSISLVVSSIMIGIITYISVLERTKEIGILRAIGASKRDVSRVFNAETLIIGFSAGVIGILTTLLLCIPINMIIRALSGIQNISAALPLGAAVILVLISMLLTFIAGLIPSGVAAKKDPVEALRSE